MPASARWTHVALPSGDVDRSIAWYTRYTPLRVLARTADDHGKNAWLGEPDRADRPFILVLVEFIEKSGTRQPQLMPFAHLGIELPTRADVDAVAAQARADGCLAWEPQQLPPPVGYVCAASDPDGNVIEFSHDQGVDEAARREWGSLAADPLPSAR